MASEVWAVALSVLLVQPVLSVLLTVRLLLVQVRLLPDSVAWAALAASEAVLLRVQVLLKVLVLPVLSVLLAHREDKLLLVRVRLLLDSVAWAASAASEAVLLVVLRHSVLQLRQLLSQLLHRLLLT